MTQITKKTPKNIVFIVLDTHRQDRLGVYGYDKPTSPNIDKFADNATVFEMAISPGQWTIPAHASMFSGEYPTTHMTVQSADALDSRFRTLAERLGEHGYHTTGFCNNPLVGVLNNGLKRGFQTFYQYGGAVPTVPERKVSAWRKPFHKLWTQYTRILRKISYPIQNLVAQRDGAFHFALNPLLVPLWSRYANFKGDTEQSIQDTNEYLRAYKFENTETSEKPLFLFVNLMETHLPYTPPDKYIKQFAPIVKRDRAAQDFIRKYNTLALRWLLPMEKPFSELEYETLSGMYDAEVAYQDAQIAQLLDTLDTPYHRKNTMVIIVGDHGEMLGEHQIMGHGLGAYQPLVHVPLLIRFPGQTEGKRVRAPVTTTHLFHTSLHAAGVDVLETEYSNEIDIASMSFAQWYHNPEKPSGHIYTEAYPPQNVISIMEKLEPGLLEAYHSRETVRGVYRKTHKYIQTENIGDDIFDLEADPDENYPLEDPALRERFQRNLGEYLERATSRRPENFQRGGVNLDDDTLRQRMRGLGYIE